MREQPAQSDQRFAPEETLLQRLRRRERELSAGPLLTDLELVNPYAPKRQLEEKCGRLSRTENA